MDLSARRIALAEVAFVALALAVGARVLAPRHVALDAAPFVGHWAWHLGVPFVLPAVVAGGLVAAGPLVTARLPWRWVAPAAGVGAIGWAVALALTDGWHQLTAPVATRYEYHAFALTIRDPMAFVRTFVARAPHLPVHVQGHPPGATLVAWGLVRIGLRGAGWLAALDIAGWGVAVAAVLTAARTVSGEAAARRAAPALLLLPAAVWAATSGDALFSAVFAVGIAIAVREGRRAALAGGVVLGVGLLLTYGGAVLLLVPASVLLHRRRVGDVLCVAGAAGAVLLAVWATTGFWWLDGLAATRHAYWLGVAARRPGLYLTTLGNPAALAVAVGPATAVGLATAMAGRRWTTVLLPLAALAAVTLADLSQLSRGEVERIWLPFAVLLGAAAVGDRRGWLAAQAATGLAVQAVLVSPW